MFEVVLTHGLKHVGEEVGLAVSLKVIHEINIRTEDELAVVACFVTRSRSLAAPVEI